VGRRMLVVDDNETNRRILCLQGRSWGMEVEETGSPGEALAWLEEGASYDLAVLDMHMPGMGMDGLELARAIRKVGLSELPLVLFSSVNYIPAEGETTPFAAFLQKPLKQSLLFDTLMDILGGREVEQPAGTGRAEFDAEMGARHPLRILLAEDNVVNQKVATRLLERLGYRPDLAANGLEAIAAVERQRYDVVLMDVQMPELDGLEATRRIVARWPGAGERPRIVAMTANATEEDRRICFEAGMEDYVSKPVRLEELVDALSRSVKRNA